MTQAVSFVFDSGSVTADGSVVVVKRSTDPVRINNSSFSVETAGIAQYAVFNNRRCANDFFWFSRTTVVRTLQDGHYVFEFLNRSGRMDDNVSGTGGTDVLW